jgi:nanoRNase/pAp phosphatase (c-di-AMP/oligoRNAs hydrolase)
MRSKNEAVDVCAICKDFGGGGHTLAAGARIKGSLAEVIKIIVGKASEAIARANPIPNATPVRGEESCGMS